MSFFDKLMGMIRMDDDDDDYDDYDEYDDEPELRKPKKKEKQPAKRSSEKRTVSAASEEDFEEEEAVSSASSSAAKFQSKNRYSRREEPEEMEEPAQNSRFSKKKVVPMRQTSKMEVCSIKPTTIDDAQEIADTLLSGRAVILNLGGSIDNRVAQSIVDFSAGACYAMGGNLKPVSEFVFLLTPRQVDMSGDFLDDKDSDYSLKSFPKDME